MAKFDKMITKVMKIKFHTKEQTQVAINQFEPIKSALEDAVSHYGNRELLDDFSSPWYRNAREHYESRLEQVDELLKNLKEKYASLPSEKGNTEVQGV
jgi:hypothetical protein